VRVDEHLVVESVDRVIEGRVVEVDRNVVYFTQCLVVRQDVKNLTAHRLADPLVFTAFCYLSAFRVT
jgi:hypothetical protein